MILNYLAYAVLLAFAVMFISGIVAYIVSHWHEVKGVVLFVLMMAVGLWALLRVI